MGRARVVATPAVLAAVAAGVATAAAVQEQPPFRSGVDVAEVDVSVVDPRGRPVHDLAASDFAVFVDGKPRRVVGARRLSPGPAASRAHPGDASGLDVLATSNASGGGDPRGRRIVIVVDRATLVAGEGWQAFRAAGDFIDRLHPSDRVALYPVWSTPARIAFTTDHDRVRREVSRMSGLGAQFIMGLEDQDLEGDPWRLGGMSVYEAFQIVVQRDARLAGEITKSLCRRCSPEAWAAMGKQVEANAILLVQFVRMGAVVARREVERLLDRLRAVAGPKTVVWLSGGFVIDMEGTRLRRIEELAAESRTTLFTLMAGQPVPFDTSRYPRSEGRRPTHTQDLRLRELGLSETARRTGGEFYRFIGNPRRWFERIEAHLSGHYLLGVEVAPDDPVEERRRIEVRVARRGAAAHVRHGNAHARVLRELRPENRTEALNVDERLMAMLRSPDTEPWLPLRVSTYAWPDGGGRARVAVTAEVGGRGVDAADVTLAFALRDSWGAVVSSGRRQMAAAAGTPRDDGAQVYTLPITAAPGRYALRVAAVDGSGRGGSVEHRLRVGLALSDAPVVLGRLVLGDAEAPVESGRGDEVVVSSGELAVALDVQAESAWVFHRVRGAVEVARDETGPPLVQVVAPLRGGEAEPRRTASARVAVGDLDPGEYVARVRVLHRDEEVERVFGRFRIPER